MIRPEVDESFAKGCVTRDRDARACGCLREVVRQELLAHAVRQFRSFLGCTRCRIARGRLAFRGALCACREEACQNIGTGTQAGEFSRNAIGGVDLDQQGAARIARDGQQFTGSRTEAEAARGNGSLCGYVNSHVPHSCTSSSQRRAGDSVDIACSNCGGFSLLQLLFDLLVAEPDVVDRARIECPRDDGCRDDHDQQR